MWKRLIAWCRLVPWCRSFQTRRAKERLERERARTQNEERLRNWIEQLDVETELLLTQRREAHCDRQHRSS